MLINIIIFFIILICLVLLFGYSNEIKEGFFDFPDAEHNKYVEDSKGKFNQLTTTIDLVDPAVPISNTSANAFKIALGGFSTDGTKNTYKLEPKTEFTLPSDSPAMFKEVKACEQYGPKCDAFDDATFAANCGVSFDSKGSGATGKPHIGGLYVSPADRQTQTVQAENVLRTGEAPYDPYKVYQPTLGTSKPGAFALDKKQCKVIKERIECETKQTFSSPNCTQCYTSQRFVRVDPKTGRIPSILFLYGNGLVTVSTADTSGASISVEQTSLNSTNPVQVTIPANAEGTVFTIDIQPPTSSTTTATATATATYIAGYLQGQTSGGTFKFDLMKLVNLDQVTNSKPRINGSVVINGFTCISMIPGNNQTTMSLSCLIPFSFLNMYDIDAMSCSNGPIITQAASATFLESDPCFGKANQPGNYQLACLQSRWIELGGTPQGTGYPSNAATANALQQSTTGEQPLDIDTIVNNLASKMTSAQTGQDSNGVALSLADWNALSMWATGTPINTPCDGITSSNGPLSQECLSYLYLNQGVSSHIGATYTLSPAAVASMKGQNTQNTYCQPGTSIDPSTPSGLTFGQSLGGINAVKQTYDQINRLANDNTQTNTARAQALEQCYGITLNSGQ